MLLAFEALAEASPEVCLWLLLILEHQVRGAQRSTLQQLHLLHMISCDTRLLSCKAATNKSAKTNLTSHSERDCFKKGIVMELLIGKKNVAIQKYCLYFFLIETLKIFFELFFTKYRISTEVNFHEGQI